MLAYLPYSDPPSDYAHIRVNGMWYEEWQGGYDDFVKRGYPRPKHKTTILAQLYSPKTADFLHGWGGNVPFLVTSHAKALFRKEGLTGFRFSRVEIVKIATRGVRNRKPTGGEPEDQITKAKDQSTTVVRPTLHAVRVTGRLEIIPKYPSSRCPGIGYVTPYELPQVGDIPDLFRPTIGGKTFQAWTYCSQRFRDVVTKNSLTNIGFESFGEHMTRFRLDCELHMANDDELLSSCSILMPATDDCRLSELQQRQQAEPLSPHEQSELNLLMQIYQEGLVRKALAYREAVRRGLLQLSRPPPLA